MILIVSNQDDRSTTKVIEWLDYFQKIWIRINEEDSIKVTFSGTDILFQLPHNQFLLSEISFCWYRRGRISSNFSEFRARSKYTIS